MSELLERIQRDQKAVCEKLGNYTVDAEGCHIHKSLIKNNSTSQIVLAHKLSNPVRWNYDACRVAWAFWHGNDAGSSLSMLCGNRSCVNVDHMAIEQRDMLTADRLRSLIDYCPETGLITRRSTSEIAGSLCHGYVRVGIDGIKYRAHRLAWLFVTGQWPDGEVDHIDGVRNNNSWGNLRIADRSGNQRNKAIQANNTSGYKGVCWSKKEGKWSARVYVDGRERFSKLFDDIDEAAIAVTEARNQLHGEFARHE